MGSSATSPQGKFQIVLCQRPSCPLLMLCISAIFILFILYSVVTPYTTDFTGAPIYDHSNCKRDWPPTPAKTSTKVLKLSLPSSSLQPAMRGYPAPIIGIEHPDTPFPRIIHQVWNSAIFPEQWRHTQQSCIKMYPDYQYMLWNFYDIEILTREHHPWLLSTWKTYPYHMQRIDVMKYLILYHYGGVYLDLDVSCVENFDAYIQKNISSVVHTVVRQSYPAWYGLDIMWSKPKSPLLWDVLVNAPYANHWYGVTYTTVMFGAGTAYFGLTLNSYPCKGHIEVVPNYFFTEKYFIHHHASSWHLWDGYIILFLYKNYKVIIPLLIIVVSAAIIACIFYTRLLQTVFFSSRIDSPKVHRYKNGFSKNNGYHTL